MANRLRNWHQMKSSRCSSWRRTPCGSSTCRRWSFRWKPLRPAPCCSEIKTTSRWVQVIRVHFYTSKIIPRFVHLHYRPTPQHVGFALPPSIFSPYLVSTSLLHLVVFGMLAPLFGVRSHLILDLLTLTLPSNPISKLTLSLLKAFLAPNDFIRALLIQHFYVDFNVENISLLLWWCCVLVSRWFSKQAWYSKWTSYLLPYLTSGIQVGGHQTGTSVYLSL